MARQRMKTQAFAQVEEAEAKMHQGDKAGAYSLFRQAAQLDPQNERAWLGSARTAEDMDDALEFVEQALELNPSNAEAHELHSWLWKPEFDLEEQARRRQLILSLVLDALIVIGSAILLAYTVLR